MAFQNGNNLCGMGSRCLFLLDAGMRGHDILPFAISAPDEHSLVKVIVSRLKIGVVGVGYWGPNWVRTLSSLPGCELAAVCDRSPGRLQYIAERFPGVPVTQNYDELLGDPTVDGVVLVTPVSTHRALAEMAFRAGKHVLVEKPLASTSEDAAAMVAAARHARKVLATGHIFVYHPAIVRLREAIQAGELGRLCYADSGRVNLGPPASEVDVVWDLAVHDVSILLSLLGREPTEVVAEGRRYIHTALTDVAFLTLRFEDGFVAQHHVSWLSPVRVRRFFVAGTKGSATFDDVLESGKLSLSDAGEDSRVGALASDVKDLFYRTGTVRTPTLTKDQPLTIEAAHFLDCMRTGRAPAADGQAGLAVVRVLEAAEQSITLGGKPIRLN